MTKRELMEMLIDDGYDMDSASATVEAYESELEDMDAQSRDNLAFLESEFAALMAGI